MLCVSCYNIPNKKRLEYYLDINDNSLMIKDLISNANNLEKSISNDSDPAQFGHMLLWAKTQYFVCKFRYKLKKENNPRQTYEFNENRPIATSNVNPDEIENLIKADEFFLKYNKKIMWYRTQRLLGLLDHNLVKKLTYFEKSLKSVLELETESRDIKKLRLAIEEVKACLAKEAHKTMVFLKAVNFKN